MKKDSNPNPNMGNTYYSVIKENPGGVQYLKVNDDQFKKVKESNLKYAAYRNDDGYINVAVKKEDGERLYKALGLELIREVGNIPHAQFKKAVDSLELIKGLTDTDITKMNNSGIKFSGFKNKYKTGEFNIYVSSDDKPKALECIGFLRNLGNKPCSKLLSGIPKDKLHKMNINEGDISKLQGVGIQYSIVNSGVLSINEVTGKYILMFNERNYNKVIDQLKPIDTGLKIPM